MTKVYIVLLRGINVGGHRKVPMLELRDLLSKLGYSNVQTYIQSGNVVLQSSANPTAIKHNIEKAISKHFGFDVIVIVKTKDELKTIYKNCPFFNEEKDKSYFIFLERTPNAEELKEVLELEYRDEKVHITKNCIYFFGAKGYGQTKFNSNFYERKLKVNATARNHKTMLKLMAMAEEAEFNP